MTTITKDTPWRHMGAVPYAIWKKRITDAGGISDYAAYDVWAALGDDSALALEQLEAESSYASRFRKIPADWWNAWNLQIAGVGMKFGSALEAAQAWRARLYDPNYKQGIYTKTVTIYDLISTYAPKSDGNDTDGYVDELVAGINRNGFDPPVTTPSTDPEPIPGEGEPMATVTFGKVPRPAFTNREIPTSQNTAFDYLGQREVRGIFLHRMEGSLWGTDEYFRTMANAAKTRQGGLTDFGTDATTGEALMWCNSSGTKSPWASGPVQNPIKSAAIFVNLYGRNAVNQYAESIETSGWGDDAVSAKWRAWVVAEIAYQADDYGRKLAAKGEKFDYTTYPNIPSEQNREFVMSHGWSYDGKRNTCAGSVIEALIPTINKEVKAILTAAQSSGVTPEPVYAPAHPVSKGSQIINDHQFLAPGGKTFQRDTIPAEWGDGKDNPTGPTIKKGTKITDDQISHYVQGTDGNLYLVLTGVSGVADGSRVPAEAVIAA